MSNPLLPLYIGTGVYGVLFIGLPLLIPSGPNQGIIRCSILISIFSMWIFWATVYIAQMNPVIGPRHANTTLIWMKHREGAVPKNLADDGDYTEVESDKDKDKEKEEALSASEHPEPTTSAEIEPDETNTNRRQYRRCLGPPDNLFECCHIPWLPAYAVDKCMKQPIDVLKLTCEEARCAFREAGWSGVNKRLVEAFYNNLVHTDGEWAKAVNLIKTQCLVTTPKFQGIYTDCIEFDIMYCAMTKMFTHSPALRWSTAASCVETRQYLSRCPLCPDACNKGSSDQSVDACRACVTL